MCYNISLIKSSSDLELRFAARFADSTLYRPMHHVSGFSSPYWPVISNDKPDPIQFFRWGLIPFWTKDDPAANRMKFRTLNARAETIGTRPAFRAAIRNKRCLILTDGFYEWHDQNHKKYPFHIRLATRDAFAMAGIWDAWEDREDGTVLNTFAIITTRANPLIARIHNTKERMPVILKRDDEQKWLGGDLETTDIASRLVPFDHGEMEAFPVSRLISARGTNTNTPEAMAPQQYEDLSMPS
jgi:putative SOS response-associated peptidase YedK